MQEGTVIGSGYTKEKLSGMDKETIIRLLPAQQDPLENIDTNLQPVLEQLAEQKDTVLAGQRKGTWQKGRFRLLRLMGRLYFSMNLKTWQIKGSLVSPSMKATSHSHAA